MKTGDRMKEARALAGASLIAAFSLGTAFLLHGSQTSSDPVAAPQTVAPASGEEIPASQTIRPDELAKEMGGKDKRIVVCVAPRFLYNGAHIPGALFHGPGSKPEGLDDLQQWAKGQARDANIVVYCGCCPMTRCPNVRPALATLRRMGFTHVKVLWLAQDFHADWMQKGYPVESTH